MRVFAEKVSLEQIDELFDNKVSARRSQAWAQSYLESNCRTESNTETKRDLKLRAEDL